MYDSPLTINNVCYDVSSTTRILDNISFKLESNTITGLLGINGAGKSTLLAICAKQLLPTTGSVYYASGQLSEKYLGYLPEIAPLIPSLSVEQYLRYIAKLRQIDLCETELTELLATCDLSPRRKQRIGRLSKGNRQRVGIAQAILHKPTLLLLDEPMSGLDPSQIIQFREILTQLKETTTILFSTHILSEVDTLCDQSLILHNQHIEVIDHHELKIQVYEVSIAGEIKLAIKNDQLTKVNYDATTQQTSVICRTQRALDEFLATCVLQKWSIRAVTPIQNTPEQAFLNAIRAPVSPASSSEQSEAVNGLAHG